MAVVFLYEETLTVWALIVVANWNLDNKLTIVAPMRANLVRVLLRVGLASFLWLLWILVGILRLSVPKSKNSLI